MICPILSIKHYFEDCHKEECAWYNRNKEECCIKALSENMEEVAEGQRTIFIREV